MSFHTARARQARRAADNLRQAQKLHALRLKRVRVIGQQHLKQKFAAERALIRAAKAKTAAIRAAKFRRFTGRARSAVQSAKRVKRTFGKFF